MAIAVDAATDVHENSGDGVVSLTHTSTGSNRAVFAGVCGTDVDALTSTSCTYDGTAMTEMWDVTSGVFMNAGYRLAGQSTGAVTVTSTIAADIPIRQGLSVVSLTGVDQTTPVGTPQSATGSTSPASLTLASVGSDDMLVDFLFLQDAGTITIGANQTERTTEDLADSWFAKTSTQSGADGAVMSWTFSASGVSWAYGAVAFKAAVSQAQAPRSIHQFRMRRQ
jgi:hypothetical protein